MNVVRQKARLDPVLVAFSWSSDISINTPISLAADDQDLSAMVEGGTGGTGGAIIAWKDYRNSTDAAIQSTGSKARGQALHLT